MSNTKRNAFWNFFDGIGQFPAFLIWTALICIVSMLASYFPLWVNVAVNVILPVLVLLKLKMVMFEKLKLSTLVLMRALILLPIFGVMEGGLFVKIVLVFLVINCMEATLTDLLKNRQPFNFVTGLVLSLSVFTLSGTWFPEIAGPFSGIYTANAGPRTDTLFVSDQTVVLGTVCWLAAYTIWNWLFVIGEFSPSIGYLHIGILSSPILSILLTGNPGYWLVFRANSLTCGGVFQIYCKDDIEKKLENEKLAAFIGKVRSAPVQIVLMVLNLILIAVPVGIYFGMI